MIDAHLKHTLLLKLHEIGVVQFGHFILKSGKESTVYLNLRPIISYPATLRLVASALYQVVERCAFDMICGVPYTALPFATCMSIDHDRPLIMRRKEKKEYGTKQQIEGVFREGQTCLIVEDVITSGASILETRNDLIQAGLVVNDVAAFIDREQGGVKTLSETCRVHTVFTMNELLNGFLSHAPLSQSEQQAINQYLHNEKSVS